MNPLLHIFLRKTIRTGALTVTDSGGSVRKFGDGTGKPVAIRFTSSRAERNVILMPGIKFGEEFMDGGFVFDEGSVYDFLELVFLNTTGAAYPTRLMSIGAAVRYATRRLRQMNTPIRARRTVASHYDLNGRLYSLFLDNDLQYSCAYYDDGIVALDDAQLAKKRHLAAKLALKPGQKVLDIGSGWGGLGLYLAERCGVDVTGVTLSEEQHQVSNRRAAERGLAGRARFLLKDYRALEGPFDRIVSVGMFEHVGVGRFPEFFDKVRSLLTPDGVMVLHSIGRFDGPGDTNAWIQKYIFPGGYIPALSEVVPVIERAGLKITDIEILRLHYAKTLRAWRERFLAHRDEVKALYDERFCRMWEFYLAGSETAFRYQDMMNFQIQFTRHQEALPLTRNYMFEAEEALRTADAAWTDRTPLKLAGE
ncbi:MAG TPA: cyclopropane-fatty-acyl-phospholipid synthase family protein [Bauldia sp.]|nr:cyclopropane-fatty-acyl-phospholipid synthase family protein [Bauldia sp.]